MKLEIKQKCIVCNGCGHLPNTSGIGKNGDSCWSCNGEGWHKVKIEVISFRVVEE